MGICTLCNTEKDTRPYGVGGSLVCFECAMSTPERKQQAERMLDLHLRAAAAHCNVIVVGEQSGPRPFVNTKPLQ